MCLMKQIIQSSQPHKNNPPNIKHEKIKNKGVCPHCGAVNE